MCLRVALGRWADTLVCVYGWETRAQHVAPLRVTPYPGLSPQGGKEPFVALRYALQVLADAGVVPCVVRKTLDERCVSDLHEGFATLQKLQGWRKGRLQDGTE